METNRLKLAGAVIFFVGCVAVLYGRYQNVRPEAVAEQVRAAERAQRQALAPLPPQEGAAPRPAMPGPGGGWGEGRMPTEAERAVMRQEMYTALNLTPEQRQKMEDIDRRFAGREGRDSWRERMQAAQEVLTPEQQQRARDMWRSRMEARMRERISVLPPEEQQLFMEKLQERRPQFEARFREMREARRAERERERNAASSPAENRP